MNEMVERVRQSLAMSDAGYGTVPSLGDVAELLQAYDRLRIRIEFLEGTLQPFSDAAVDVEGYPDDHAVGCDPTMELSVEVDEGAFGPLKVIHLRRARTALVDEDQK